MKQAVFDIEADNVDPKLVKNVWCIAIKDVDTNEVFKYGPTEIEEGVKKLSSYDRVIGHNCISYDLPILTRLFAYKGSSYIDTLILSRLSNPDRSMPWGSSGPWRPHSVEAWGIRLGGRQKVEHEDWSKFSEEMMNRCVTDVEIQTEIYKALWKEFRE